MILPSSLLSPTVNALEHISLRCYLPGFATESDRNRWVGASDVSGDQEWFWVNGAPVSGGSPFWATDMPEDHSYSDAHEYCGYMSHRMRYYLANQRCSEYEYFICKLNVLE